MSRTSELCLFVSDLHGRLDRYERLFAAVLVRRPAAVFLGGDILPSGIAAALIGVIKTEDFIAQYFALKLREIRAALGRDYPDVFVILGNDDGRAAEDDLLAGEAKGLWHYVHNRVVPFGEYSVLGYSFVPPSPFLLKDWERYDVSRYLDPGCVSPEEGLHSQPFDAQAIRYGTIERDLGALTRNVDLSRSICLFHTPPYNTALDWVDHNGKTVDGVEPDRHIGSIAVRRLIESHQPLLTLHGHAHESVALSGQWRDQIGSTRMFGAATAGPELALISFHLEDLATAQRELL